MPAAKIEKYIGRIALIVYQDKKGEITQRRIRVISIIAGKVRAYDLVKRAPRVFELENILAIQLMGRAV